jgi:arsenate reductase
MQETPFIKTEVFFKEALADLKIDTNRTQLLNSIAAYIANELKANKKVNINYICTHNSRRSQLAQVWSSYATAHFKFAEVNSFSGGTAITTFYRNTVKTLQEVGFSFQIIEFSHQNPVYSINYKNGINPIIGFSKLFNDAHNKTPFIAITTCNNADENCPFIPEAIERFHLPFVDPKAYDNTQYQSEKYLEANKQIAGEIHYIFKTVKSII